MSDVGNERRSEDYEIKGNYLVCLKCTKKISRYAYMGTTKRSNKSAMINHQKGHWHREMGLVKPEWPEWPNNKKEKTMSKEKLKQATRISFAFGRKYNLGNYESMDVHMSMSEDVDGIDADATMEHLQEKVSEWITEFEKEQGLIKSKRGKR